MIVASCDPGKSVTHRVCDHVVFVLIRREELVVVPDSDPVVLKPVVEEVVCHVKDQEHHAKVQELTADVADKVDAVPAVNVLHEVLKIKLWHVLLYLVWINLSILSR